MSSDRIILENITRVILFDEMTFEDVIGQIQPLVSNAILAVKDGCELRIFRKREDFPLGVRYEGKSEAEFYSFRSITDDSLYVIFGQQAASIFYPSLSRGTINASITTNGVTLSAVSIVSMKAEINEKELSF